MSESWRREERTSLSFGASWPSASPQQLTPQHQQRALEMSGRDVRDILELSQQAPPSSSSLQPPRRTGGPPDPRVKRPDGITRELYALIGDNAPSLALAHTVKPKFKERIKRTGPSVKWQWTAFSNPSRGIAKPGEEGGEKEEKEREASRKLRLHHWVKDLPADHATGAPDHKFAKFNTSSQPYSYTAAEYEALPPGALLRARKKERELTSCELQRPTGTRRRRTTSSRWLTSTTCGSW